MIVSEYEFYPFSWVTSYKCVLFSFHLHTSLSRLLLTVCDGCTCVRVVMLPVVHWCGAEVRSSTDTLSLHYLSGCRSEALVKLFTHLTCIGSVGFCHSRVHVWPLKYTYTHTHTHLVPVNDWLEILPCHCLSPWCHWFNWVGWVPSNPWGYWKLAKEKKKKQGWWEWTGVLKQTWNSPRLRQIRVTAADLLLSLCLNDFI